MEKGRDEKCLEKKRDRKSPVTVRFINLHSLLYGRCCSSHTYPSMPSGVDFVHTIHMYFVLIREDRDDTGSLVHLIVVKLAYGYVLQ